MHPPTWNEEGVARLQLDGCGGCVLADVGSSKLAVVRVRAGPYETTVQGSALRKGAGRVRSRRRSERDGLAPAQQDVSVGKVVEVSRARHPRRGEEQRDDVLSSIRGTPGCCPRCDARERPGRTTHQLDAHVAVRRRTRQLGGHAPGKAFQGVAVPYPPPELAHVGEHCGGRVDEVRRARRTLCVALSTHARAAHHFRQTRAVAPIGELGYRRRIKGDYLLWSRAPDARPAPPVSERRCS